MSIITVSFPVITSADTQPILEPELVSPVSPPTGYAVNRSFKAVITQYSETDSCHNPDTQGRCIMASGRAVYVGAVACPSFLVLGTKVRLRGIVYTCEDRYAEWLDVKRARPTIDIFVAKNPHGRTTEVVDILAPTES